MSSIPVFAQNEFEDHEVVTLGIDDGGDFTIQGIVGRGVSNVDRTWSWYEINGYGATYAYGTYPIVQVGSVLTKNGLLINSDSDTVPTATAFVDHEDWVAATVGEVWRVDSTHHINTGFFSDNDTTYSVYVVQ